MKTAVYALVLLGVIATAQAQYASCPNATIQKGVNVIGDWKGYWLSATGNTYYQAAATVTFQQSALGKISARVNISQPVCTGGCPSTKPPHVEPCVVDYGITCLDASDPTVWGFIAPPKASRPACLNTPSAWKCDYHMTGTYYQDTDHPASFFVRMAYEPDVPGPPLHLMPWGNFFTGCPTIDSGVSLQGRLIRITE